MLSFMQRSDHVRDPEAKAREPGASQLFSLQSPRPRSWRADGLPMKDAATMLQDLERLSIEIELSSR